MDVSIYNHTDASSLLAKVFGRAIANPDRSIHFQHGWEKPPIVALRPAGKETLA